MRLPDKLTHGDNLSNLFEKFNRAIDYLREIRLIAGRGIRLFQHPAGITIESTATGTGGGIFSPEGIWTPTVAKNYSYGPNTYPYAVIFSDARRVFHGLMQYDDLKLYLPTSAVEAGTIWIYAVETVDTVVLRWNLSALWYHTVPDQYQFRPVRYIGKITITDGVFGFTGLPTDTVIFTGGPDDAVRLAVKSFGANGWKSALSDNLTPIVWRTRPALWEDLTTGEVAAAGIRYDYPDTIELPTVSGLGSVLYIAAGSNGITAVQASSRIGGYGKWRLLAELGAEDALGFRGISWQDPLYTARQTDRQVAFGSSSLTVRQDIILPDGTIETAQLNIANSAVSSTLTVCLDVIYYVGTSGSRAWYQLRLSTATPPAAPGDPHVLWTWTVAKVYPASAGTAAVEHYYPLITPAYGPKLAMYLYEQTMQTISSYHT